MQPNTPVTPNPNPAPFVSGDMSGGMGAAPAAPVVAPMPAMPAVENAPRHNRLKTALMAAIAVVVVIGAFVGGFYANKHIASTSEANATATSRKFVAALNAGDNAKAYALTSAGLQHRQTKAQFATNIGNLKANTPLYLSQMTWFNGKTAQYLLHEDGLPATSAGVTTGTFTITLVKDGMLHWKVDTVSVE